MMYLGILIGFVATFGVILIVIWLSEKEERKQKKYRANLDEEIKINRVNDNINELDSMLEDYNNAIKRQKWQQFHKWEIEAEVNNFVVCPKCKGTKISVQTIYDDDAPAYASNSCNDCGYDLATWTFEKEDVFK